MNKEENRKENPEIDIRGRIFDIQRWTTGRESAPLYFLQAALCAVSGAATPNHRRAVLNWRFSGINVSAAEAA